MNSQPRTFLFIATLAILTTIADPLWAQCPASLSVSGPDANGMLTVSASTQGACGDTELDLTLDGGLLDTRYCRDTVCSYANTLFVACLKAGAHTIGLTAKCGHYRPDGLCDWFDPAGQNSAGFTVQPTPTVSLAYSGPDEEGHGAADVTYTFPYNGDGGVAMFVDGTDIAGGVFGKSGTLHRAINFTCKTPGSHRIEAKAYSCTNPQIPPPTDPDFIATDSTTATVAGQSQVSASYDEDKQLLNLTTHFPNTDYSLQRGIHVYADGNEAPISWPVECTNAVTNSCSPHLTLSCGTDHQVRVVIQSCGRSESMYNAETTINVAQACQNDQTWCNNCSTSSSSGVLSDSPSASPSSPGVCVGEPVNIASGDVIVTLPLFTLSHPAIPLRFALTFHSSRPSFANTNTDPLGPGWTHPFNQSVHQVGVDRLQLYTPTGDRFYFDRYSPTVWLAGRPGFVTDHIVRDGATYVLHYQNGGKSTFDVSTGRWLATSDRWGNTINATYDGGGNLSAVTGVDGRAIAFEYAAGVISRVVLPDGTAWRFEYATLGGPVLTKIFDPISAAQAWRTFSYAAQTDGVFRSLTAMRDRGGKLLEGHSYRYDDDRAYTSVVEGGRESHLIDFDTPAPGKSRVTVTLDNNITQVTDYTLARLKGSSVPTQIDGVCASCGSITDSQTLTYDGAGHITSSTDAGGHVTRYSYDGAGNVLIKTEAAGTPRERSTIYAYEYPTWPNFLTKLTQPSATGNGQKVTQFAWNIDETLLTTTVTGKLTPDPGSAMSTVRMTSFDARHRIVSQDGPRTDVADITTRTYYSDTDSEANRRGRLQKIVDAVGLVTTFDDYDVYGTPRKITDPNGVVTQLQTDSRGRLVSTTNKAVAGDPNENADYTSTVTYDERDRLAERISARGTRMRYRHEDGTDRLVDITRLDLGGNEVERKHFTLDLVGNRKKEEDQSCSAPAPSCAAWSTQRSQSFVFDNKRRLVEVDQPVPSGAKVLYAYDSDGRLVSVQDENHSSPNSTYSYDELSRLAIVTQKLGNGTVVTRYIYDAQDNLASITDPNGNATSYAFDDFGRLHQQLSPVSGTTSYAYDPAGNLISTTDANAATTTRTFDAANRIMSSAANRAGTPTESITRTHDDATSGKYGRGRLASMTDPSGSTTYAYDRRGLLRSDDKIIEGNAYATRYAYDADGNRSTITYPSGRRVTYAFDFANRPTTAALDAAPLVNGATYLPFGPITTMTLANGTTVTRTFDARYRITENKLLAAGTPLAAYTYTPDPLGNILAITDALDSAYSRAFSYDDLSRLTTANSSLWGNGAYQYDAMGNMTSLTVGRSSTFAHVGTTPKLSTVTDAAGITSVGYDAAGNELSIGAASYSYSPRNLLNAADGLSYTYDGRGVRVITAAANALEIASLDVSPAGIEWPATGTGTLTLNAPAPPPGVVVTLASSNAGLIRPRSSRVTVAAGQTAAQFTVDAVQVSQMTDARLTAAYGASIKTKAVTAIPPQMHVSSVTFNPASVQGPNPSTGTVTTDKPAPAGGAIIALSSSDTSVATVPASVTVPAGSTSATFSVSTAVVPNSSAVTITARYDYPTAPGFSSSSSGTLTVTPPPIRLQSIALNPARVIRGWTSTGTATLNVNAPIGGAVVSLNSSDTNVATVPATVIITAGTKSADFTISTNRTIIVDTNVTITGVYATTISATLTVAACTQPPAPPPTLGSDAVWFDDAVPNAATLNGIWNWDTTQKASGTKSHTDGYGAALHEHGFSNATPFPIAANDQVVTYVLLNSCDPPDEIMLEWQAGADGEHRAYWGANVIAAGTSDTPGRIAMGALPPLGQWVRLTTSAESLGLAGRKLTGMSFKTYGGQAWFDRSGTGTCTVSPAPLREPTAGARIWIDDSLPTGAIPSGTWVWDTNKKVTGLKSNTEPGAPGNHAHSFIGATSAMNPGVHENLVAYILASNCDPPREIMLEWYESGNRWEHRAFWGEDLIPLGTLGTASRRRVGNIPTLGEWIRVEVPAFDVGLENRIVTGMSFRLYNGKAWFDTIGVVSVGGASLPPPVQAVVASVSANFVDPHPAVTSTLPARRYSFYSPELNLLAESEFSSVASPAIQSEYVWFDGQPIAQIENATSTLHYYFNDHLGTPLLTTNSLGAVDWRIEREPYGARYVTGTGIDRDQPLAFPGQEDGVRSDRSYNIFRWYRADWGRYTQPDPIEGVVTQLAVRRLGVFATAQARLSILRSLDTDTYMYAAKDPLLKTDAFGLRPQTPGCDYIPDCLEAMYPYTRVCCDEHDKCYFRNNCKMERDWPRTLAILAALGRGYAVPTPPCVQCNIDVMDCFLNALRPRAPTAGAAPNTPFPPL